MSDSTKQLKIQIDLEKTGNGAEAQAELDKIKETTKATGEASTEAAAAGTAAADKETESTKGLDIGKRELLESMHAITRQFPILGEVARNAFNPIALGIFGVTSGFETLNNIVEKTAAAMGGISMPDLGGDLQPLDDLAAKYNALNTAISAAQASFDSAAATFERENTAINAQVTALKNLIAAQKEKALADLDIERATGKIGPGAYNIKKSIIEQGASDETTQLEIEQRNEELAAKKREAAKATADANKAQAKVDAFKLPGDDADVDKQIKDQQDRVDELRKQAAAARAEAKKQQDIQTGETGDFRDRFSSAVGKITNAYNYGGWATPGEIEAMQTKTAREKEAQAAAVEKEIARQKAEKEARAKAREEADKAAAAAVKANDAIEGEDDPKKPGSTAWRNAQDKSTQGTRDKAAEENRFASDVDQFAKDAAEYKKLAGHTDPASIAKARAAMADMFALVNDAASIMKELANGGQNVADLSKEIATLRAQLQSLQGVGIR